jgi:hypothetical protein
VNELTHTHDEGTTEIVFLPNRPGPIVLGQPATGPELTYKSPEGSFTSLAIKFGTPLSSELTELPSAVSGEPHQNAVSDGQLVAED